jgi:multiple sugar transport system substrate-binding protein
MITLASKNFPRRFISIFLVIFLTVVLLSTYRGLANPTVVLNLLLTAPDAKPWYSMIQEFEQTHPGIKINLIAGPNATNLIEDLYTSAFILGDSPYDLINMDVVWSAKFAAAGWLLDLNNRLNSIDLGDFSPVDMAAGYYEGKLYRVPVRSDVGVLYYRKDLLDEEGIAPPQTFEQLQKISSSLKQQGKVKWGYLWQGRQYEGLITMFVEILQGFGGFWVNSDTLEVGLDRPETLQAIAFLQDSIAQGISPPGSTTYMEEDTRRIFQNGDAAFLRSWPYVWPLANADDSSVKNKIGVKPMVGIAQKTGSGCLGGWGLGIARSSKHPEEAWEIIRYITSKEVQKKFILSAGFIPSRISLFTDPEIMEKYPHYPKLLEISKTATSRPIIPQYAQISDILQRYLSAALTNYLPPEKAMRLAANETRQILGKNRV